MDESLIDSDGLSLSRKSLLPGAGFFYPDSLDEEFAERRTREAVEGAEAVVVADSDADGLGCAALVRELYGAALDATTFEESLAAEFAGDEAAVSGVDAAPESDVPGADGDADAADVGESSDVADGDGDADAAGEDVDLEDHERSPVALVGAGPHSLSEALERVAEYADPGVDVFICDLCPDAYEPVSEPLGSLLETAASVDWFDHHQWDEAVATAVRDAGVRLVVGDSDEECSTDVALRSLDYDFPDHLHELAAVTRDHDLWLREDPRSDDLADYAYWTSPEEYVAIVGEYGPDLPASVEQFIAERRVEKETLVEKAVDRAEFKEVGPWTVGVTYGRCSQNEVAEAMREQGSDAAVVVKPAGSASIRGTEIFERCHEVAGQVNGGGHPKAAGCKPDIYDDMLDYAHHWTTQGSAAKRVILAAFERVADRVADEDGDDAESGDGSDTDDRGD
jgi:oligoribonuclease NrnB/cAMP/cGMP phosphodiesterase (DHH superfamily)